MAFSTKIKRDNDPFKKYWGLLLVGFGMVGMWAMLPALEAGTGSIHVSGSSQKSEEQSLDSLSNPAGAPGSVIDLSMDGAGGYKKKADGDVTSSLYQASEAAAPGAPIAEIKAAPAVSTFASALKNVGKKADASWGGAKVQKAFNAPKGSFGGLSGLGGGSSGSSGASASAGVTTFGKAGSNPGLTNTRGLGSGGDDSDKDGPSFMRALNSAAQTSQAAAASGSADGAAAGVGSTFDGGTAGKPGMAPATTGGVYGELDKAPVNLKDGTVKGKPTDKDALKKAAKDIGKDIKGKDATSEETLKEQRKQQMMMMIMQMLLGGLMGGMMPPVAK